MITFWSECVKADVDVCNLEGIVPRTEKPGDLVWEEQANCSIPQELGNYLQSK